ncbi:MAG: type I restriction enzyme HsdR N-terminal domain-containing protein [Candidatus Methanogranum gryphiswaldense]|nr:MAG: type I restriction enzyme HsdR N-terminal domain-containing protein [Candidatus Methanogranum sp. U3.2.1]
MPEFLTVGFIHLYNSSFFMSCSFEDKLNTLIAQIPARKNVIKTEEATKTGLIMPFLTALGYDCTNPLEVCPEYIADFGVKKGEKIDYAILKDNKPIIFIECKSIGFDLDDKKFGSQLYRYFSTSNTKIGILTNGIEYRFFSDIKTENKMDTTPFLIINLENINERQIKALSKFSRDEFNIESLLPSAEDMMIRNEIMKAIESELNNPSKEFEDILIVKVYEGRITPNVRQRYSPIIKDAIKTYISEKVTSRLMTAMDHEKESNLPVEPESVVEEDSIVTTEDEKEGYMMVRAICAQLIDPGRVYMRDAKSYCAILFDDNNRKPICRLYFNSPTIRYISTFEGEIENKVKIEKTMDIYKMQENIVATVKKYLEKQL